MFMQQMADHRACSLLPNGTDRVCGFRTRNQNSDFCNENCRRHNPKCIVTTDDLVVNNRDSVRINVKLNNLFLKILYVFLFIIFVDYIVL
jgi:hypothetical protein